ncbi:MAG: VUT family protein, partial [Oscillospiraceae bacterium]|nr:VUT family protein [Oscillospiraceae bacterium]
MNNLIIIGEILFVFTALLLCKKFFGKAGVVAWVPIATVLANIITAKNAEIMGLSTAIGTVMFASTFLAT